MGAIAGIRGYSERSAQGRLAIYVTWRKAERWLDARQDEQREKCATAYLDTLQARRFVCRKPRRQVRLGRTAEQCQHRKNYGRNCSRLDRTQGQTRAANKAFRRDIGHENYFFAELNADAGQAGATARGDGLATHMWTHHCLGRSNSYFSSLHFMWTLPKSSSVQQIRPEVAGTRQTRSPDQIRGGRGGGAARCWR